MPNLGVAGGQDHLKYELKISILASVRSGIA